MRTIDGRYQVLGPIGKGGMGEVFKVIDLVDGTIKALKMMKPEFSAMADEFRDEFKILTELRFPYLIRVHNFGRDEYGTLYFSMDYASGGDLSRRLSQMSIEQVQRCGEMIMAALDYIHARGIVHGDLKPSNVLFDEMGNALLVDFGLAMRLKNTSPARRSGTLEFAAPELLSSGFLSPSSDLYSIGLVLYEMLFKQPLLQGSPEDMLKRKMRGFTSLLTIPDMPQAKELEVFFLRLLHPDPHERFSGAGQVLRAWRRIFGQNSIDQPILVRQYFERAAFCGRRQELELLREHVDHAVSGRNSLIYIRGESGVGKSRLIEEFKYAMQVVGQQVLLANCHQSDDPPLTPLVAIIEQIVLHYDPQRRLFEAQGDEIKRLFPRSYPDMPKDPDVRAGRRRLFDNIYSYLQTVAAGRCLVMVIEDLQWADPLSIEFINWLSRMLSNPLGNGGGLVLVVTSQPGTVSSQWEFRSRCLEIELAPADWDLWRDFLKRLFGDFDPPIEFARRLHAETGGNFLFAEEVLKSLADLGLIVRERGFWRLRTPEATDLPLPASVKDAIENRLKQLGLPHLAIVELLAAVDTFVAEDELLRLAGYDQRGKEVIEELVGLRVLRRQDGAVGFLHKQIREVAWQMIPGPRRQMLCLRAANYYEAVQAPAELLARLFVEAKQYPRAYQYLKESATAAERVYAWDQSAQVYERILTLLEEWSPAPPEARFETLLGAGKALMFIDPRRAAYFLEKALAETANTGDAIYNRVITLLKQAENAQHLGENETALRLFDEANNLSVPWPELQGEGFLGKGFVLSKLGDLENAAKCYFKALDHFVDNPERLCRVLGYLGIIAKRRGDFHGALDFYQRALKVSIERDYRWAAMNLYGNMANVYSAMGDDHRALEYYQQSLAVAKSLSDRRIEGINLLNIGHAHVGLGNTRQALRGFLQAVAILRAIGDRSSEAVVYNNLGELYLRLGRFRRASEYYTKGLSLAREISEPRIELANLRGLADWHLTLRNYDRAESLIEQAAALAQTIGDEEQKSWCQCVRAEIEFCRQRFSFARTEIERLLASEPKDVGLRVRAGAILVGVELADGRKEAAMRVLRQLDEAKLPPSLRVTIARLKAEAFATGQPTSEDLKTAQAEIERAMRLADLLGQTSQKPELYLTLARIQRQRGQSPQATIDKAFLLARQLCAGLDQQVQEQYLAKFAVGRRLASGEEVIMSNMRNREKRLETLLEVSKIINSILELDPLLNRIMDLLLENLMAERGFIMLKDKDGNLEPVVARNLDQKNIPDDLTISHSTIMDVMSSGQPLVINRAPGEKHDRESVTDFQISSIVCAPLVMRNQTIGIVYVDNRVDGRAFDQSDLDFLVGFCHLSAIAIENARLAGQLSERNLYLQRQVEKSSGFGNIIGRSSPMQRVFYMAQAVAATEATVVISGESGTGKEILARAIHYSGPRKNGKFIPVDCGALPESLLESELFGHKKGSFTGAIADRAGLFEEADGGTIFLDEITNTSPNFQVKLLRVLQEGEFRRVGDTKTRRVDVRIIAATNKDLAAEVAAGNFREDLFYRLNVVNIHLPSLRDRKEDIPLLVEYFLDAICRKMKIPKKSITARAIDYMVNYRWPGNVRQLENVIERMVIFSSGEVIDIGDLPQEIRGMLESAPSSTKTQLVVPRTRAELKAAKTELDRLFLTALLERVDGNVMKAAKISGMDRTQIHHMMNKFKIDRNAFRGKRSVA